MRLINNIRYANVARPMIVRTAKKPCEIAARLSAAMAERGISQRDLSRRSGVSQAFLSELLSGKRQDAGVKVVLKLELALGEPRIHLTDLRDQIPEVVGLDEFLASPLGADVTEEERNFLRVARWAPAGLRATIRDWDRYLGLVRNMIRDQKN